MVHLWIFSEYLFDTQPQSALPSPVMSDSAATLKHHLGHKFHEVFQQKQGLYADLPAAKISEMMKCNSLDNAPTQSLLSVVNGILDESAQRNNGEIPHRVACLLRKVVQEIERRISTQAEHLRTQNNLYKAREEKYQSRIRLLETIASVPKQEDEPLKSTAAATIKGDGEDVKRFKQEKEQKDLENSKLRQELQTTKSDDVKRLVEEKEKKDLEILKLRQELPTTKSDDVKRLIEEKEKADLEIAKLSREVQTTESDDVKGLIEEKEKTDFEIANLSQVQTTESDDVSGLIEEKEKTDFEISKSRQEVQNTKSNDVKGLIEEKEKTDFEIAKLSQVQTTESDDVKGLIEEKEKTDFEISKSRQEVQNTKSNDVKGLIEEKEKTDFEIAKLSQVQTTESDDVKGLIEEKEKTDFEIAKLSQVQTTESDDVKGLIEEKEKTDLEISKSRQEVQNTKSNDVKRLIEEKEKTDPEISNLKQELQSNKSDDVKRLIEEKEQKDLEILKLRQELQTTKSDDVKRLIEEIEQKDLETSKLRQELQTTTSDDVKRLIEEKEKTDLEISNLRQQLQSIKSDDVKRLIEDKQEKDLEISKLRQQLQSTKSDDVKRLIEEKEQKDLEISKLRQQLQSTKSDDVKRLIEEKEQKDLEISKLRQQLQSTTNDDVKRLIEEKEKKISILQQELHIVKNDDVKRSSIEDEEKKDTEISKLRQELLCRESDEEKEKKDQEISKLRQELQSIKSDVEKRLTEEKDKKDLEILRLRQELSTKSDDEKRLTEEKEKKDLEISRLREELQSTKSEDEKRLIEEKEKKNLEISRLRQELKSTKIEDEKRLMEEKGKKDCQISTLQQELHNMRSTYDVRCRQLEAKAKSAQLELEQRKQQFDNLLTESRNKAKQILEHSASKEKHMLEFHFAFTKKMRFSCESIKQEIMTCQMSYTQDIKQLGIAFKTQAETAANYHEVIAENRKLFNDIQELKGNIRVYCRVRPFFPGQKEKRSTMEHIGQNGDLILGNPNKPGKEGHRFFRFNKVYGPTSTQVEVFKDVQPLVRSVLDGYNVCIFAYGQTGSGKTYTMTGPNGATEENWGVNYRALNDLFDISKKRTSSMMYEIGVQMVEIYNEQVRDLLSNGGSQKKIGILTQSQLNGLAVPDATMCPVESSSSVLELMGIGLKNRAVGATAMNERSSRSHSVVSIHVRGRDKTGSTMHGNLHLVDLAGSERVDRSEVTGDRLREAQHINKSLSSLGDVIFSLSQKSQHVPYRNSKLTQLLQASLGGQAKTVMFVQLNPDATSYSETLSTLKFAERVSGIELGAAKSSKENNNVKELMEQVASLKDAITKKDDEIDRLQILKELKNVASPRKCRSPSPSNDTVKKIPKPPRSRSIGHSDGDHQQLMDVNGGSGRSSPARSQGSGYRYADSEDRSYNTSDNEPDVSPDSSFRSKRPKILERQKSAPKSVRPLQKQLEISTSPSFRRNPSSPKARWS